jgi:rhomboid family GlyGly-CTERM serine protease
MNGSAVHPFVQRARHLPGASLLLALVAVVFWFSPEISAMGEWQRGHPLHLWRWFTGHFCHWSSEHLIWDTIVFVALGAICEQRSRSQFLLCNAVSALAIIAATTVFLPNIHSYRGLSGIDSALFGWLIAELFQQARDRRDWRRLALICAFAFAFIAKVIWECTTSSTLFVSNAQSEFVPMPLAHAVGAFAGVALSIARRVKISFSARFPQALGKARKPSATNIPLPT